MAFGLGDEFANSLVAGNVVTWPPASGTRRKPGASDNDGSRTAVPSRGRKCAETRSHACCACRYHWQTCLGRDSGGSGGGGGGLEESC